MRQAKAGDHWRNLVSRSYPTELRQFSFTDIVGLGSGSLDFANGITAICGSNGAGKSTLLKSIYYSLSVSSIEFAPDFLRKLETANVTINLSVVKTEQVRTIVNGYRDTLPPPLDELGVLWLEPSHDSPDLIKRFANTSNLDELLDTVEPRQSEEEELQALNYLIGKGYEKVDTYEFEDMFDRDIVPYFVVTALGQTYRAESMGLGEFSIFYILWSLRQLKKRSILLIEEPECFVSPRSQRYLMNYLAQLSGKMDICCVISTHSPSVLTQIPLANVRVLASNQANSFLQVPNSQSEYLGVLGLDRHKSGIIFVEDGAAREFLRQLLSRYEDSLLSDYAIVDAGSVERVLQALQAMPKHRDMRWLRLIGVLDGDMSDREMSSDINWPVKFLPGTLPPEGLLMESANKKVGYFASLLGRTEQQLTMYLNSLRGYDHHDWCHELSRLLGITYEQLFGALVAVWVSLDENVALALEAINEINEGLSAFE